MRAGGRYDRPLGSRTGTKHPAPLGNSHTRSVIDRVGSTLPLRSQNEGSGYSYADSTTTVREIRTASIGQVHTAASRSCRVSRPDSHDRGALVCRELDSRMVHPVLRRHLPARSSRPRRDPDVRDDNPRSRRLLEVLRQQAVACSYRVWILTTTTSDCASPPGRSTAAR